MFPVDWGKLHPLPRVANKHHRENRETHTWQGRRDYFASLEKTPLVVAAELVTPIIHAERGLTHLDSILAFAVMTAHPAPSNFDDAATFPLPLKMAWISDEGLPLWACSPLMALSEPHEFREYWHKRYPSHRAEFGHKLSANSRAGRYKEYRTPVVASQVGKLHALSIGHAEEIEKLLSVVTHIGKKGSMGYGRVAKWSVTPADHSLDDVLSLRTVPVEYYAGKTPKGILSPLRGWTPPYWYAPWWRACMVPKI